MLILQKACRRVNSTSVSEEIKVVKKKHVKYGTCCTWKAVCDRFTMDHGPRQTSQFAKCKEKSVCEPKCKVMVPGFKRHNGICLLPSSNVCTQQGPLGGSRSVAVVKFHFKCQRRCLRALCSRTTDTVGNAWLRQRG